VLRLGWAKGPSAAVRTGCGPSTADRTDLEVAAWDIADLGSCHLGKKPWEIATWEKSLGKYLTS